MQIELTKKQYRRLLDLVYIGNWVLNSTRGTDRFSDYDEVEGLLFTKAPSVGMPELIDTWPGGACPSRAFVTGGIHEAIAYYEDAIFFDILAEELARRDLGYPDSGMYNELNERMQKYLAEFDANGVENVTVDGID